MHQIIAYKASRERVLKVIITARANKYWPIKHVLYSCRLAITARGHDNSTHMITTPCLGSVI